MRDKNGKSFAVGDILVHEIHPRGERVRCVNIGERTVTFHRIDHTGKRMPPDLRLSHEECMQQSVSWIVPYRSGEIVEKDNIMNMANKVRELRIALAAGLKYHSRFGMALPETVGGSWNHRWRHWRDLLDGKPLPLGLIDSEVGDMFAFWYNELRLPPAEYDAVLGMFFQKEPCHESQTTSSQTE
jgi:hypothetical protein